MWVEKIELFHVAMPLVTPFRTAYGQERAIESVLVAMHSQGEVGWGEASALAVPAYSPEYAAGVFLTMKHWLAPAIVGKDIRAASELAAQFRWIKGNPFAKAGIESAWWDLHARQAGEPLCTQLGGQATSVSVGADFGIADTLDDLLGDVGKAVAAQFPRVKLKIKPGWDVEVVRAVRREFPTLIMHVDGNSGYRLEDREIFEALDELSLEMIEQPLAHDDLLDHAQLQRGLRTPICLDESITSLRRAQQAVESGACRYINIKPPRVGGLSNAIAIHDFCQATATPCWVGSMLESAVGAAHCLAFATLPGFTYAADILTSDFLYGQEDLGVPATTLSQPGTMTPSSSPGIGVRPHPQKLAARTLTIASFAV